jgi:hypothetical protein
MIYYLIFILNNKSDKKKENNNIIMVKFLKKFFNVNLYWNKKIIPLWKKQKIYGSSMVIKKRKTLSSGDIQDMKMKVANNKKLLNNNYLNLLKKKGYNDRKMNLNNNGIITIFNYRRKLKDKIENLNPDYNYFQKLNSPLELGSSFKRRRTISSFKLKGKNLSNNKNLEIFKPYWNNPDSKKKVEGNENNIIFKRNVLEKRYNKIKTGKISNKLMEPHYFFTFKYNEKSMPSQIKHWISSVYNFLKIDKSGNNYLDIYTSQLIKSFFTVKYIKRKNFEIKSLALLEGFKLTSNSLILKQVKRVIDNTFPKAKAILKSESGISVSAAIKYKWLKEQAKFSSQFFEFMKSNNKNLYLKRTMMMMLFKKKTYLRKLGRVIIGKPYFKHTSYNVLIDLFVYNNKLYKIYKFKNILSRRSMYKYMYSMYVDYSKKIQETINRPRFFYINIIEPKVYTHYYNVIRIYQEFLLKKDNQPLILNVSLYLIRLNFLKYIQKTQGLAHSYLKKFNNFNLLKDSISNALIIKNNILNGNENNNISFKRKFYDRWINKNIYNRYSQNYINKWKRIKNNLYTINKVKFNKEDWVFDIKDYRKKKAVKKRKSKYLTYIKYMEEYKRKSETPVDLSTLTLWSTKGLTNTSHNYNENKRKKYQKKRFRRDKFSYNQYKKKHGYDKSGKPVDPKLWEAKLQDFHLYSRLQKRDTLGNRIFHNNYSKFNDDIKTLNLTYSSQFNKNHEENLNLVFNYKKQDLYKYKKLSRSQWNKLNHKKYIYMFINRIIINNKIHILDKLWTSYYTFNHKVNIKNKNNDNNILIHDLNKYIKINDNESNNKKEKYFKSNILIKYKEKEDKIKYNNSKILWDGLDISILKILKTIFNISSSNKDEWINNEKGGYLYHKIKDDTFGNIWYSSYIRSVIKKEFYRVNRDILVVDKKNIIPYENNNIKNYYSSDNLDSYVSYEEIEVIATQKRLPMIIWSSEKPHKRENTMINQWGYNEELFKPYYRYMIPLLITRTYWYFLWLRGWNIDHLEYNKYIKEYFTPFKKDGSKILTFILVKILLNLLRYNYRSLISIKPHMYYLNKIRSFETKYKKLHVNTWRTSVQNLRKLKKIPLYFWKRYFKLSSYYFGRICQNVQLDNKRKTLIPFVLYFEDILYNIYGKWAIIRLWPLKKVYLSSYILAGRILLLIIWRKKQNSRNVSFESMVQDFMTKIRMSQIEKFYDLYTNYQSRWPDKFINHLKGENTYRSLTYSNLEYMDDKEDRQYTLNTYPSYQPRWSSYISSFSSSYYYNNTYKIIKLKLSKIKNIRLRKRFDLNKEWLKPINSYLLNLKNYSDISGIKLIIAGRAGITNNNLRARFKTHIYGNMIGPRYIITKLNKSKTNSNLHLRGCIKSHIDYSWTFSKTINGSISFKVWIASFMSSDIHELLLFLIHIKELYSQFMNQSIKPKSFFSKKMKKKKEKKKRIIKKQIKKEDIIILKQSIKEKEKEKEDYYLYYNNNKKTNKKIRYNPNISFNFHMKIKKIKDNSNNIDIIKDNSNNIIKDNSNNINIIKDKSNNINIIKDKSINIKDNQKVIDNLSNKDKRILYYNDRKAKKAETSKERKSHVYHANMVLSSNKKNDLF